MFRYTTNTHPAQARRVITRSDGSMYKNDTVTAVNSQSDFIFHGENVPNWRARMASGLDVTTDLQGYRYTAKRDSGTYRYVFGGGSKSYGLQEGDLNFYNLSGNPVHPSVVSQARTQAMVNFTKNYNKKTTQWDSGVFAGELFETVRLLASPAKSMRGAINTLYRDLKHTLKGVPPRSTRYKKQLAGTWLEWNFGVKPLVQDLDDAARAFRSMASGRCFDMIRITGEGEAFQRVSAASGLFDWAPLPEIPGAGKFYLDVVDSSQVTIRGGWRNSNPSGEMPLPQQFGVGLQDVLPTAWELVPWSFFADYFSNIGDVLDAWSMRFVEFAWINETVRNCRTFTYSDIMPIAPAPPAVCTASGGHAVLKRYDVTRARFNNDWNPSIQLKMPSFGEQPEKWLNVSALLQMRLP